MPHILSKWAVVGCSAVLSFVKSQIRMEEANIEAPDTMLGVLRNATAAAHANVERHIDLEVPWTRARYLAFLRATLAVVQPTEPELRRCFGDTRFPLLAGPSARLRSDIENLGASADGLTTHRVPALSSDAQAFGAAYVLLGSLLGGQILARSIAAQLSLAPSYLTYLRPNGEVGAAWRHFTAELNAWGVAAAAPARRTTVDVALHLFDAFAAAFAREGVA